jgi:hypothetical protein
MSNRVDKGRRKYSYSGDPKPFWIYAEKKEFVAADHETEEQKKRRTERLKALKKKEDEILAQRKKQRTQERIKFLKEIESGRKKV